MGRLLGGYYMLNGAGIDLDEPPGTVTGSWDKAVAALASNKPIIIYNVVMGGKKLSPMAVTGFYNSSTVIRLYAQGMWDYIQIKNTDEVLSSTIT